MLKIKINISKKLFYIYLIFLTLFVIFQALYLVSNYTTEQNWNNAQERENYLIGKLISYIMNSLIAICMLVYVVLGRKKLQLGYVFCFIFILISIALVVAPHVVFNFNNDRLILGLGIVISFIGSGLLLTTLFFTFQLYKAKQLAKFEYYQKKASQKFKN